MCLFYTLSFSRYILFYFRIAIKDRRIVLTLRKKVITEIFDFLFYCLQNCEACFIERWIDVIIDKEMRNIQNDEVWKYENYKI